MTKNEPTTVGDLMVPLARYATVHQDATLAGALETLSVAERTNNDRGYRFRAVLVLDDRDEVVGKLSLWAILRSLEPRLLNDERLASALSLAGLGEVAIERLEAELADRSGSVNAMCLRASQVTAREAMLPAGEAIPAETPLRQAIHLLVLRHAQSLLVSREGRVVGLLRLVDVFEVVEEKIRRLCAS